MAAYIFDSATNASLVASHLYGCVIDFNVVKYSYHDYAAWDTAVALSNLSNQNYCKVNESCYISPPFGELPEKTIQPYAWITCEEAYRRGYNYGAWINCDRYCHEIMQDIYSLLRFSPCSQDNYTNEWRVIKGINWGNIPIQQCLSASTLSKIARRLFDYNTAYELYLQHQIYSRESSVEDFVARFKGFYESHENFAKSEYTYLCDNHEIFINWTDVSQYLFFYQGKFIDVRVNDFICVFRAQLD